MPGSSYPKGSSQYINRLNKIKILNLIRESGSISRADIAKSSGISAPTVTRIVESLINEAGLIQEIGEGASKGGRRPTLVEFAGLDNFVVGVDLGTTHIYGVLANLNAEVIAEVRYETRVEDGLETIIERTIDALCDLRNHPKVHGKRIFGIGMAVAGLVDRERNILAYSPDFHWVEADIIELMRKRCDLPIIFDNVTRVMALGELFYGIGRDVKNFVVVNVGYGIGAGIIINGKPLFGSRGMAGEFGHVTLDKDSPVVCECGNSGCLEALASGRAIALAARNRIAEHAKTKLVELCENAPERLTAKMVADAAEAGDALSLSVFTEAAEYLGIGIAGLINLFNPQLVVVGGGVSQAGDLLFDTIRTVVQKRSLEKTAKDVQIIQASFGKDSAVMGAVALILNQVLQLNFEST